MFDRFVRQVSPPLEDRATRRTFSSYLESPNIILLGDPGQVRVICSRKRRNVGLPSDCTYVPEHSIPLS